MQEMKNDPDEAIAEYTEALEQYLWIADQKDLLFPIELSSVYEKLSKLYHQVGNFSKAAEARLLAKSVEAEWERRMDDVIKKEECDDTFDPEQ